MRRAPQALDSKSVRPLWFALATLSLVLATACGDPDRDERLTGSPDRDAPPFHQSLYRWETFPLSADANGPWTLEERAAFYGVPGGVVLAWDGRRTVQRTFGFMSSAADAERMSADTIFRVGSRVSAGVSALVVAAQLTESSRNLNRPLREELATTRLPANLRAVTLGQLLSHSAGLGPARLDGGATELDAILANATREFEPGSEARFSETGYAVIQRVFENATVRSWKRLSQQRLFEPLGLDSTSFDAPVDGARTSSNHDLRGRPQRQTSGASAARGLYSTAPNLASIAQAVQASFARTGSTRLLKPRQLLFVFEPEVDSWGMGWERWQPRTASRQEPQFAVAMSDNETSLMVFDLDAPRGLVVLTNGARGGALAREVLLGIAAQFGWPTFEQTSRFPTPPPESSVRALVGDWSLGNRRLEVTWNDGTLRLAGLSEAPTPMLYLGANEWMLRDAPHRVRLTDGPPRQLSVDGALAILATRPEEEPEAISH